VISLQAKAMPNGGYRTSSAMQRKLRRVTEEWLLLAADRRIWHSSARHSSAASQRTYCHFCSAGRQPDFSLTSHDATRRGDVILCALSAAELAEQISRAERV